MSDRPPRARRRTVRALAIALLVVGVLWVAAQFVMERWLVAYAEDYRLELQERLARPVRFENLDVSVWQARARIDTLHIGAARHEPRGTPAALQVRSAELRVGVLRTLLSLGARPHIRSLRLSGLEAHAVRFADGSLNWQDLAERFRTDEPVEPRAQQRWRQTVVDLLQVDDSVLTFRVLGATQQPARISNLALSVENWGPGRTSTVGLGAAVLASDPNLDVRGRLAGLAPDESLQVHQFTVQMKPTELAPLGPLLTALAPSGTLPERGVLQANLRSEQEPDGVVHAGQISLRQARMPGGRPFDAHLELDLISGDGDRMQLRQGELRVDDMALRMQGLVAGLRRDLPRIEQLDVRSEALSFDRLRAALPAFDSWTHPVRVRGPFSVRAAAPEIAGSNPRRQVEIELRLAELSTADRFQWPQREAEPAPSAWTRLLAHTDGRLLVAVRQGRVLGIDYQGFDSRLRVHQQQVQAERLQVGVFGGMLAASGSTLPLLDQRAPRHLRGSVQDIDLAALLSAVVGDHELMSGQLSAELDLRMAGGGPGRWAESLTGALEGTLADSALLSGNGYLALVRHLEQLAPLPSLRRSLAAAPERLQLAERWPLGDVAGRVRFEDGALLIPQPLKASTPQGALQVEGRVSATADSDLQCTLSLSPQALGELIGGEVPVSEAVPVPFRIRGPLLEPVFNFGDVRPILRALAQAQVDDVLEDAPDAVRERVPEPVRRLLR